MNKKLIGKIVVLSLVVIMLGTFIKQQIEKSEAYTPAGYEVKLDGEVGVKKGDIAPDFTLQTLDGKTVKLSDYRGKKVVVNFWATWCNPCRTEMPHMQKYYKKSAKKDQVEILALNLTYNDKGPKNVQKFVDSYDLTFPIVLMENDQLLNAYKVVAMPSTFFIDTEGRVQFHYTGGLTQKKLEEYIEQIN